MALYTPFVCTQAVIPYLGSLIIHVLRKTLYPLYVHAGRSLELGYYKAH